MGKGGFWDKYNQKRNELITNTYYHGPGTYTNKYPKNLFDSVGARHDNRYKKYDHPYTMYNDADRKYNQDRGHRYAKGSRQKATSLGGKIYFGTKKRLTNEEYELSRPKGMQHFLKHPHSHPEDETYPAKKKKTSMPVKNYGRKAAKKVYKKRTYTNKKKRNMHKKKYVKREGAKGFAQRVQNALVRAEPPILKVETGFGEVFAGANSDNYWDPTDLRSFTATTLNNYMDIAYGAHTDYQKIKVTSNNRIEMTNFANFPMSFTIYHYRKKKVKDVDVTVGGSIATPIYIIGLDAADEPAVANTFADQRANIDMSKLMTAGVTTTASWSNSADYVTSFFELGDYPRLKKTYAFKKIVSKKMQAGDNVVVTLHYTPVNYQNLTGDTSGANQLVPEGFIIRCHSYPLSRSGTNAEAGTAAGVFGVIWTRRTYIKKIPNSTVQFTPVYARNDRTNTTGFNVNPDDTAATAAVVIP